MARSVPHPLWQSEERSRAVVGYAALVLVPPLLMVVVLAAKFQGLPAVTAVDHAQLARHVAAGEGFVTTFIRPLSLVFKADLANHPDLYNAPVHPLVLALFYRTLHPSDQVTAGAGAVLWILSVWLTFGVARRWLSPGVAALAALFHACNVPALIAATSGLPQPLMAIGVLLAVWLAFPDPHEEGTVADLPGWRLALVGMVSALATLTHYLLGTVALALGVYLVASQPTRDEGRGTFVVPPSGGRDALTGTLRTRLPVTRHKGRVLAWFMAGFLLPLLPWMGRNFRVVGSPVFSLFWYEVLARTATYPGESVWRMATLPPPPVFFLVQHPMEVARKVLLGLHQFGGTTLTVINPVISFLFLAALLSATESPRVRGLLGVVAGSLALGVADSFLLRPEPLLPLAWEPLLAIIGAAYLCEQVPQRFPLVSLEAEGGGLPADGPGRPAAGGWRRAAAYLGVVGLVGFPLFLFVSVSRPEPAPGVREQVEPLKRLVSPEATVMTDQPAAVAWYADRRAVWLYQREDDWDLLERAVGPVDAVYVTPEITRMAAEEPGDGWIWVASPRGIYRGLMPVYNAPLAGTLRVRPEGWIPRPRDPETPR